MALSDQTATEQASGTHHPEQSSFELSVSSPSVSDGLKSSYAYGRADVPKRSTTSRPSPRETPLQPCANTTLTRTRVVTRRRSSQLSAPTPRSSRSHAVAAKSGPLSNWRLLARHVLSTQHQHEAHIPNRSERERAAGAVKPSSRRSTLTGFSEGGSSCKKQQVEAV